MKDVVVQLQKFIAEAEGRAGHRRWLEDNNLKVYVRCARRVMPDRTTIKTLDIASVTSVRPGEGVFSWFLDAAEKLNPWDALYVENVMTPRFANYFRNRGWIEIPGVTPCFVLLSSHENQPQ